MFECGFPVAKSTLQQWRTGLSLDPNYFAAKRIPGRPRSLTHEDEELLGGFILHQNALNNKVTYKALDAFLRAELDVETSPSTLITYVHAGGFSQQVAKVRPKSDTLVSHHQKLALGLAFIDELVASDFFKAARHRVFAIDVTHTSHRKEIHKTIAPRNGCVFRSFRALFLSFVIDLFLTFRRALSWSLQWRYAVCCRRDP